jgi:hypothetical protein
MNERLSKNKNIEATPIIQKNGQEFSLHSCLSLILTLVNTIMSYSMCCYLVFAILMIRHFFNWISIHSTFKVPLVLMVLPIPVLKTPLSTFIFKCKYEQALGLADLQ